MPGRPQPLDEGRRRVSADDAQPAELEMVRVPPRSGADLQNRSRSDESGEMIEVGDLLRPRPRTVTQILASRFLIGGERDIARTGHRRIAGTWPVNRPAPRGIASD